MRFQGKWIQVVGLMAACCCLPGIAAAGTFSYSGVFDTDDQVWQVQFTVPFTTTVTLESFSYGGGTNGNGTTFDPGGFGPDLSLFYATGTQAFIVDDAIGGNIPDGCGPRSIDGAVNLCLDSYFTQSLSAGSYIVTITQQGNNSNGTLGDGFAQQGNGNFTGGPFIDAFGNQRNGNWAFDISGEGVSVGSPAPEPASILLTLLVIPGMVALGRRRRRQSATQS
jgi:hypothetical protein